MLASLPFLSTEKQKHVDALTASKTTVGFAGGRAGGMWKCHLQGKGRINWRVSEFPKELQQAQGSTFPHPGPALGVSFPYHTGFHSRHFNRLLHLKDKAATGQLGEAGGVTPSYQAILRNTGFLSL